MFSSGFLSTSCAPLIFTVAWCLGMAFPSLLGPVNPVSVLKLEARNYTAPCNSDPPTKLFNGIHRKYTTEYMHTHILSPLSTIIPLLSPIINGATILFKSLMNR